MCRRLPACTRVFQCTHTGVLGCTHACLRGCTRETSGAHNHSFGRMLIRLQAYAVAPLREHTWGVHMHLRPRAHASLVASMCVFWRAHSQVFGRTRVWVHTSMSSSTGMRVLGCMHVSRRAHAGVSSGTSNCLQMHTCTCIFGCVHACSGTRMLARFQPRHMHHRAYAHIFGHGHVHLLQVHTCATLGARTSVFGHVHASSGTSTSPHVRAHTYSHVSSGMCMHLRASSRTIWCAHATSGVLTHFFS